MMCRTRLICRLPPRESRWRTWSPEEASIGAVPVQDAKWLLSGNRVMSPTSTEQPGRAGRADAVQVQSASVPVAATQLGQFLVRRLLALVDPLEIADQLGGDPAAGLAGDVPRAHGGQQLLAWAADRYFFAPPGISSSSRWCSWDDLAGVVLARAHRRRSTSTRSTASCSSLMTGRSPAHPGADQGDGVGVGGVGLAALPGGEHPRPRGQLRWDVDDGLAVGEQPLGDVPADAVAALDRPDPLGPRLAPASIAS